MSSCAITTIRLCAFASLSKQTVKGITRKIVLENKIIAPKIASLAFLNYKEIASKIAFAFLLNKEIAPKNALKNKKIPQKIAFALV